MYFVGSLAQPFILFFLFFSARQQVALWTHTHTSPAKHRSTHKNWDVADFFFGFISYSENEAGRRGGRPKYSLKISTDHDLLSISWSAYAAEHCLSETSISRLVNWFRSNYNQKHLKGDHQFRKTGDDGFFPTFLGTPNNGCCGASTASLCDNLCCCICCFCICFACSRRSRSMRSFSSILEWEKVKGMLRIFAHTTKDYIS